MLLPDIAADDEDGIDRLALAHIGYNTVDRAEFIIRRPTPIERAGRTVAGSVWGDEEREVSVGEDGVRGDVRRSGEDTDGHVGMRSP